MIRSKGARSPHMLEEIQRAMNAIGAEPRPAAWVGNKVAIWDMLIDGGVRIEPDGTPSAMLLRYAGMEVRYDEKYPPGMVAVLDQHGDVMLRLIQDHKCHWYAMHLDSQMNSDEPINPRHWGKEA